jgi:hypothetical protein
VLIIECYNFPIIISESEIYKLGMILGALIRKEKQLDFATHGVKSNN